MIPEAVSPLRRRMIEDMTIRQFGAHTQRDYIRQVREFIAFLGCHLERDEISRNLWGIPESASTPSPALSTECRRAASTS